MFSNLDLKNKIGQLRGKTIALVYIFEKEDAPGFEHYWVWKSDIISGWLNAIQELDCLPFILDVRTFAEKAANRTLPHVDFVINLNCGSRVLSSMGLVPSICSFLAIPCIPCNTISIVTSENKYISNLLASAMSLNVPESLKVSSPNGIYRPLNLGSSIGVKKGHIALPIIAGTYQQFIPGFDITIPILYNPILCEIDLLPPILYLPDSLDPNWIFDEEAKKKDKGFSTIPIMKVDKEVRNKLLNFARVFPICTYGRIDARLRISEGKLSSENTIEVLRLEDLYFIEINSMPTIERDDSFEYSIIAAKKDEENSFYNCINWYAEAVGSPSINGFLVLCWMLSFAKAMY